MNMLSTDTSPSDVPFRPNEKVLYVEDEEQCLKDGLEALSRFTGICKGVRSMELAMELLDEGTHEGVYEYQRKDSSGQVVQWDDAADDSEFVPDYVIHDCRPLRMEGDEADDPQAGDDLYAFFIQNHLPILVLSGDGQDTKARQDPYLSHPPVAWFDKANLGLATYQRAVGAYRYFQASQTAE